MKKRNASAFNAVDGSSHRHRERLLAVLSGLIQQHGVVGVLRQARGEAIEEIEEYIHRVGIDLGEDEREGIVGGRPHGGIEVRWKRSACRRGTAHPRPWATSGGHCAPSGRSSHRP